MKTAIRAALATLGISLSIPTNGEPVTLTVTAFPAVDQIVKSAIPAWKKIHPDVDIKVVGREYADHHNAMTMALATGSNQADVMAVELGFLGRFAEGGGLEDLSKAPYNGRQYEQRFVAYTFPLATSTHGELVAMPTDIGPGTLFYRQDILQKSGVKEADLTKSWETFVAAGKKIKAKTGAYLLANAHDISEVIIRSNLKAGEGIYFDKSGKALVDTPRFVKAFELAKQVRDSGLDGKIGAWSNEWTESFKRGTVATQMMGAWLGGHLANNFAPNTKGLWRVANLPNGAYAGWGGTFYAIPKKSKNKDVAWEFIKFMTLSKDLQMAAFTEQDAFPALREAHTGPFYEQPSEFFGGQKVRALWRDAAARIPATDVNKYDQVAAEIVGSELDKVLEEGKAVSAALADAKAQIEKRARR